MGYFVKQQQEGNAYSMTKALSPLTTNPSNRSCASHRRVQYCRSQWKILTQVILRCHHTWPLRSFWYAILPLLETFVYLISGRPKGTGFPPNSWAPPSHSPLKCSSFPSQAQEMEGLRLCPGVTSPTLLPPQVILFNLRKNHYDEDNQARGANLEISPMLTCTTCLFCASVLLSDRHLKHVQAEQNFLHPSFYPIFSENTSLP